MRLAASTKWGRIKVGGVDGCGRQRRTTDATATGNLRRWSEHHWHIPRCTGELWAGNGESPLDWWWTLRLVHALLDWRESGRRFSATGLDWSYTHRRVDLLQYHQHRVLRLPDNETRTHRQTLRSVNHLINNNNNNNNNNNKWTFL